MIDHTHDITLRSWVASANDAQTDFPIQNLPFGTFRRAGSDESFRVGVAIGDKVLDLKLALQQCPWDGELPELLQPLADGDLNRFMTLGNDARRKLRHALAAALTENSLQGPFLELCLLPQSQAEMALPCRIGEYTMFCAGIHHAGAVGKLLRPGSPLLPNYKWLPIGQHGRASSIAPSGQAVRRPNGQFKGDAEAPVFGPCQRLDFELGVGAIVGTASERGSPLPIAQAEEHLFGLLLVNNWTARDLQAWEQAPLGPFLSKSFCTTVSPWIVTMEALAPFRSACAAHDPQPLPHLDAPADRERGAIDMTLEAWWHGTELRSQPSPAHRLASASFLDAYWTWAQMLVHLTSVGCSVQPGDLLGSGAISGPAPDAGGSMFELTRGGQQPLALPGGARRAFLHDGDTVTLRAHCVAPEARRIGFGTCAATVQGAA